MAENSPGPFFAKINYASDFAPHSMEIPTLNASVAILDPSHWNFLHPDSDTSDVTADITDLCNLFKPLFKAHVNFTSFTLYSQPDPDDSPTPVFSDTLAVIGTSAEAGWDKASQQTFTFRTNEFGMYKLVLLDVNSFNVWDKRTVLSSGGAEDLIRDYITNADSWILGRDGGRPFTFLQTTKTLNEKLRRSYRMT